MEQDLLKKVNRAIKLIKSASKKAKEHEQPLEVAYSGGKDSDVILELTKMAGVDFRAIYKNTTIDPPGTLKHVRERGVEILYPKENFFQLMCRKGIPTRKVRFCCKVLKEYPVLDYVIIGVRRDESRSRKQRYKEPEVCRNYGKGRKVRQILPILDWSTEDVAEFLKEKNITCAPHYYDSKGTFHPERRLGCMCCPLMSIKKRREEFHKYPRMIKIYCRAGEMYRHNHPLSKNVKKFKTVYEWICFLIMGKSYHYFRERIGPTLFDDGIDCKSYLEEKFEIIL